MHFFDRALIDRLAAGFELLEVAEYEEGKLPPPVRGDDALACSRRTAPNPLSRRTG